MRCLSSILVAALMASAAPVQAQPEPDQVLSKVREHVMYARYRKAIDRADELLGRQDLSARERNLALEAKAIAQLAKRDKADAEETLDTLYSRDPEHRLSDQDASPVVQGAFARARERKRETVPVAVEHEPPSLDGRRAPRIDAQIAEGADAVAEVRLAYREGTGGSWTNVVMTREGDTVHARVPLASHDEAYTLQYVLEARAPSGAPLAKRGTRSDPLALDVPEASKDVAAVPSEPKDEPAKDDGGVASEWWFWTLIGAVAVGGAVTAGVLLSGDEQGPPSSTLGTRQLQLRF